MQNHLRNLTILTTLFAIPLSAMGNTYGEYTCRFVVQGVPEGAVREEMLYSLGGSRDGAVLMVEGTINSGESQRLEQAIRETMSRTPISEVWLNSGGGNAVEGMEMGRVLRRYGVATRVPKGNMCFSACSYAFLGGPFRTVEEGADYGVHMFTSSEYGAGKVIEGLEVDLKNKNPGKFENTQNEVKGIEQSSAKFAAQFVDYLSEMGISTQVGEHNFATANKGGSCPPPSVLKQWNVVNSD